MVLLLVGGHLRPSDGVSDLRYSPSVLRVGRANTRLPRRKFVLQDLILKLHRCIGSYTNNPFPDTYTHVDRRVDQWSTGLRRVVGTGLQSDPRVRRRRPTYGKPLYGQKSILSSPVRSFQYGVSYSLWGRLRTGAGRGTDSTQKQRQGDNYRSRRQPYSVTTSTLLMTKIHREVNPQESRVKTRVNGSVSGEVDRPRSTDQYQTK